MIALEVRARRQQAAAVAPTPEFPNSPDSSLAVVQVDQKPHLVDLEVQAVVETVLEIVMEVLLHLTQVVVVEDQEE